MAPTAWPSSWTRTASPPPRSTATRARASESRPSTTSSPGGSPSWSPPRSRPAGSTSTGCRTSSTSKCRPCRRTTSIEFGRTGRAGLEGDAVSLVCIDETGLLDEVQSLLRQTIAREVIPGFEVDRSIRPEPIRGLGRVFRPSMGRRQSFARPSVAQRPVEAWRPAEIRHPVAASGARPAQSASFQARPEGFNLSAPVEPRRAANGYRRPTANDFDSTGSSRPAPVPYRPAQQRSSAPRYDGPRYDGPRYDAPRPAAPRFEQRPDRPATPGRPAAPRTSGHRYDEQPRYDTSRPAAPRYEQRPDRPANGERPAARPFDRPTTRPATRPAARAYDRPAARPYDRQADQLFDRREEYVSLPGERLARRERRQD